MATFYIHECQNRSPHLGFDPDIFEDARLKEFVFNRKQQGFFFGLHPSLKGIETYEKERND